MAHTACNNTDNRASHDNHNVQRNEEVPNNSNSNENVINRDVTKQYLDTRYVGASEACWIILEKRMHGRSHSIMRLPVHLPGEQNIYVNEDGNIEGFLNNLNRYDATVLFQT